MTSQADTRRLILRGGGSAGIGYVIRFGARFLFLFVAARLFGAALFGAYSLAIAVVELGAAVGGLGMKRLLFQLLEDRRPERSEVHIVLDAALLVGIASLLLAALAMIVGLALPPTVLAPNTASAIALVAPMIAGQALIDLFLAATRWKERMRYQVAARSIVEPYAGIAAAGLAYVVGFEQTGLLISYWAGTLSALGYALFGTRHCFGGLDLRRYRPNARHLRWVLGTSILPTLTDLLGALFGRLDLYLVGIFFGEAPAGIYNMARQIRTPIRQVREGFDGMVTPIIARTLNARGAKDAGAATASVGRMILAIQLPILVTLVALGLPLLHWLGPEFAVGYWPLVILAAAETIQSAFGVGELILFYRRPGLGLLVTCASILVNIVAAWLLVGPLGVEGAALAVLLAVIVGALVRRQMLKTGFGIAIPISYTAGPIAAAAGAAVLVLLVRPIPMPLPPAAKDALLLMLALATYGGALKLWLNVRREKLLPVHPEV